MGVLFISEHSAQVCSRRQQEPPSLGVGVFSDKEHQSPLGNTATLNTYHQNLLSADGSLVISWQKCPERRKGDREKLKDTCPVGTDLQGPLHASITWSHKSHFGQRELRAHQRKNTSHQPSAETWTRTVVQPSSHRAPGPSHCSW